MAARPEVFQRETDAFSWYMERDPGLRSTVVAVVWLASSPDWGTVLAKLDRATRAIPIFRTRVVEPPGRVATPRRVVATDFDLAWHARRVDAPAPHTKATVIELARIAAMTAFDPAHPLWEFTLVEHLEDGGAAFIMKFHHSLTDGVGGMKLALQLFDLEPESPPLGAELEAPAVESLTPARLVRESVVHDLGKVARVLRGGAVAAVPALLAAARHPLGAAADAVATARSIGRLVAPVPHTMSPLMTARGLRRELDVLTVPVADLKRAAAVANGTLNDGFLAGLTGGLRRYHDRHGTPVDALRLTMPINIRTELDPEGGNRITLQRFVVPVGNEDPVARIVAIDACCRAARGERSLPNTNAVAGALNLLPAGVIGGMLKHVDFLASDVPGFPFPVYLAGAEVTGYVPFGPTIGAAFNATLVSYKGTCWIGVTIDSAAIPDADVFMQCLSEGFDEVLALAERHEARVGPPAVPPA
jgi:WS/DGAT/MGAT family acyltransferase